MSYYEDLTHYNYLHHSKKELNIGWLQKDKTFNIGETPDGFLEKLKVYLEHSIFQTRGFHNCEFCNSEVISSNEIRVVSESGTIYASPMLVIHYVEFHNYLPPEEFIRAVMFGPEPASKEYLNALSLMPTFFERKKLEDGEDKKDQKIETLLADDLSESVNQQLMKELLDDYPELKKFMKAYKKIAPAAHGFKKNTK